jgi:hypothetical protein
MLRALLEDLARGARGAGDEAPLAAPRRQREQRFGILRIGETLGEGGRHVEGRLRARVTPGNEAAFTT